MTEKEFDLKAEDLAARFERRVEASVDNFDKCITRKYNESRLFHYSTRGISTIAEVGLLIGAKHLSDRGCKTAAIWCAGLGIIGLATDLLRIFMFRREK